MPSVISHPAVPVAMACAIGMQRLPPKLLAVSVAASMLPDADVLGFRFGLPYAHLLGHRGFFHSPIFALLVGLLGIVAWRRLGSSRLAVFAVLFLSVLSHGILDAATSGGLGIAFLSPFRNDRFFLPWQPIAVSPLGVGRFFTPRGLKVIQSELL